MLQVTELEGDARAGGATPRSRGTRREAATVLAVESYDAAAYAPGSRGARGFCSHPRCKEAPAVTVRLLRDTGVPVRRGLCDGHAPPRTRLSAAG